MTPFSPFDQFNAPLPSYQLPGGGIGGGLPQNQPAQPFVWGQGGARLSPEQILARQEMARDQMTADFSPVGSIWEGLGRVVNNVTGALESRKLDKAAAANQAESGALMQALLGGGQDAVTQALVNPNVSPEVRQFAQMQWERANPKPRQPFEFEQMLSAGGFAPGTPQYQEEVRKLWNNKTDPYTTISTPDFFFSGRQSQVGSALQGGGDPFVSPTPGASAPPASAASGEFMTPAQYNEVRRGLGNGFGAWQKQYQVPVRVSSPEEMASLPVGTPVVSPDGRRGVKK